MVGWYSSPMRQKIMAKEESPIPAESQFMYGGKMFFIKDKAIPTVLPALMQQIKANKGKDLGEKKGENDGR